jgi:PAS domain S-box-containing protein
MSGRAGARRPRVRAAPVTTDVALLERRVRELQLLHETGRRLTSLRDMDLLLPEIVEQLRRVLGVEIVSIMLVEAQAGELRIAAASGLPQDVVTHARVPLGKGVSGQTALRGQPILIRDMREHAEFAPSPHAAQYTTESLLCVPLRVGDRVLGVINVNNKLTGEALDDDDLALVVTFSAQAALAIENSRLYGGLEREVERVTAALRRSNAELRLTQEFTEAILQQMSSGLVVVDNDGRVLKANAAAGALLMPDGSGPEGRRLEDLFGPEGARAVTSADVGLSQERREVLARPSGRSDVLLGFSSSPLLDADGKQSGVVVIFRDLTQLKKMEAELVRMDRMASLGVLGAGIAHEIRNPLAAIRFNLDFLREEGRGADELDVILKNVARLDDLVRKLLRFARPQQPSFEKQALRPRVEAVIALIAKQAQAAGAEVLTRFMPSAPDVRIEGPQVEQVVLNVSLNGIQCMPRGGRLQFSTRVTAHGPDKEQHLELAVSDDGPGLSDEAARQIFDPFFTTRQEGTGLGLAVAQRIMEDHGGYIEVGRRGQGEGRGATFLIGFPLSRAGR